MASSFYWSSVISVALNYKTIPLINKDLERQPFPVSIICNDDKDHTFLKS